MKERRRSPAATTGSTPAGKSARLSIRLPDHQKELIERAAGYSGLNMTDFTISTLVDRAREVIQDNEITVLSDRDRDAFLYMLDNPPEPNEALRQAAKRYRQQVLRSED